MDAETKKCWKCSEEKSIKDDYCRGGKDSVCKKCRYELNSEWAKENREKLRPKRAEYMRQYRARKAEEAKKKTTEEPSGEGGSTPA